MVLHHGYVLAQTLDFLFVLSQVNGCSCDLLLEGGGEIWEGLGVLTSILLMLTLTLESPPA